MKIRTISEKKLNWLVMLVFAASLIAISAFHEPWFDEAQSWQIAKCASYWDMLFVTPHYEGHPALWWLILSIPAKLGVPFEVGLKSVGFMFSVISAALIIFKAPFPRVIRHALPFSYFIFYQYGVIVRPYCMMLLAMILLGIFFKSRHEHPFRYTLILIFLCFTSAYGMLIACGIALCMTYEIVRQKGFRTAVRELLTDHRTLALIVLLVVAIILVLQIRSYPDTYIAQDEADHHNSFIVCLICTLFTVMGDCLITQTSWFLRDQTLLQNSDIPASGLILYTCVGIFIWVILIMVSSRKSLKYLVVPFLIYAVFAAKVYFSAHHEGTALFIIIFWLWITYEDTEPCYYWHKCCNRLKDKDANALKKLCFLFIGASIVVNAYWTVGSSVKDIRYAYSHGRDGAAFIRKHGMEDALIFCKWGTDGEKQDYGNTFDIGVAVPILAYFRHNIIANVNKGRDDSGYRRYKTASDAENKDNIAYWKRCGKPEVVIGNMKISDIFEGVSLKGDYTLVHYMPYGGIYKNTTVLNHTPVYVRNDCLKKYNVHKIKEVELSGLLQ